MTPPGSGDVAALVADGAGAGVSVTTVPLKKSASHCAVLVALPPE
ncbi:MAG: hypothetical protein ACYDGR_00785 [Candidatus Dormibacteria bacterium]